MPISFLHPKYLPTWFGVLFLWFLTILPIKIQFFVGRLIGSIAHKLMKKRVAVVKKNIAWCFPKKSKIAVDEIAKQHYLNLGLGIIETANGFFISDKKLKKRFTFENLDLLKEQLTTKKPVIILGGHFTHLLLICRMLNLMISPLGGGFVFFEQKNQVIAWLMRITMSWRGAFMITNADMRGMIKFLKTNKPLFYISDQDFGEVGSVFAPFFEIPTATTMATARLAKISKASVMPLSYKRIDKKYILKLASKIEDYPLSDELENATKTNSVLEEQIKEAETQYFWAHKRFKTRPNNEQNPY